MEKNVGDFDAYIRITAGLSMLGVGVLRSSRAMIFLGAMKVAEGVTRFCPMLYMLNLSTVNLDANIKKAMQNNKEAQPQTAETQ